MSAPAVLIHRGCCFVGQVVVRGAAQIEGHLEGDVCGPEASLATGSLVVGEQAQIDGSVKLADLTVLGEVWGDVWAKRVRVGPQGQLWGRVTAELVEYFPELSAPA